MDETVQQLRHLLKLAADLRGFAAEASYPDYARKLLAAAAELEIRAEILSGQRSEPADSETAASYRSIDIRI
jgi:hypothetical protein